jgi:YHS domain-containing protein
MVRILLYLFDVALSLLLWKALGRALRGFFGAPGNFSSIGHGSAPGHARAETPAGKMARDPVCGMFVSTEVSHQLNHGTETLHFCSRQCLERYKEDGANASA